MKQQWQQMTDQQKKLTIVLVIVIVLAIVLIAWQLLPKPRPQATQETGTLAGPAGPVSPMGPAPGATSPGAPGFETAGAPPAPGAPTPGAPTPGGPSPEAGLGAPMPAPGAPPLGETVAGAPPTGAPAAPPAGKLETPPRPGRSDPFGDLPPARAIAPLTVELPPTPPPVIVTRSGAIGTESFSTQDLASLPSLQGRTVDLRTYFSSPQKQEPAEQGELTGWRLTGTILSESSVSAIIQMPDGRTRVVRPGDRVAFGGSEYTVARVEEQQVVLQTGEGREHIVPRRPTVTFTPSPRGAMGPAYEPPGFAGTGGY